MFVTDYGTEGAAISQFAIDQGDVAKSVGDAVRQHFFVPAGQRILFEQARDERGMWAETHLIPLSDPAYRLQIQLRVVRSEAGTALFATGFYYRGTVLFGLRRFVLLVTSEMPECQAVIN